MIRIFNKELVAVENGAAKNVATVYCNSSDTKPTSDLANGSTLVEVDTGKNYLFNEATSSWVEVSGGGGSVNTNSVETGETSLVNLHGKVGMVMLNHFGELGIDQAAAAFADALTNHDISMTVTLTLDGQTVTAPFQPPVMNGNNYALPVGVVSGNASAGLNKAALITVYWDGNNFSLFTACLFGSDGTATDLTPMASQIPCTLKTYFHTMPTD